MSNKTLDELLCQRQPSAPEQAVFDAWAEARRHPEALARVRRAVRDLGLEMPRRSPSRLRPSLL
ncbi:hypothetical protein [Stutzerimonas tarimensis]|uniref:Uncharacterized protein n=1 Tax=Stutzerimonas tarimensis TaxID=1507735 RepID=A0ABV7T841_9GAMM